MRTLPAGRAQEDAFAFAIDSDGVLCGCAFVMKGYPTRDVAYLALIVLMEQAQGRYLGVRCLRQVEDLALSWNCTRLEGVVDAQNARSAALWARLGFRELYRRELPWLVGPAIVGAKDLTCSRHGMRVKAGQLCSTTTKFGVSDYAATKGFFVKALEPLAFVLGRDGHSIEAVCQQPEAQGFIPIPNSKEL